jgi:hypothetical protein
MATVVLTPAQPPPRGRAASRVEKRLYLPAPACSRPASGGTTSRSLVTPGGRTDGVAPRYLPRRSCCSQMARTGGWDQSHGPGRGPPFWPPPAVSTASLGTTNTGESKHMCTGEAGWQAPASLGHVAAVR